MGGSSELGPYLAHQIDARYIEVEHNQRLMDNKVEVSPGVHIEYDLYGASEAVEKIVFISGLMSSRIEWSMVINQIFSRESKRFQVLVLDNRGCGGSSSPSGRYTTSMLADDTLHVIDHLGWKKFHVVGLSMGGMIAQEVASKAQDRVLSMVLLVTHSGGFSGVPGMAQIWGQLQIVRLIIAVKNVEEWAKSIVEIMHTPEYLQEKADDGTERTNRQKWQDVLLARAKYAKARGKGLKQPGIIGQICASQTHRLTYSAADSIKALKIPILVIGASKDIVVNVKNTKYVSKLLDADYVEVEAGHIVTGQGLKETVDGIFMVIDKAATAQRN